MRSIGSLVLVAALVTAAAPASAETRVQAPAGLSEVVIGRDDGQPAVIPPEYGRLVGVTANDEMHYLFFEDHQGTVRIVLIGPRGAVQRARSGVQLVAPATYVLPRRAAPQQP